jgi:predicted RNA-binding protein with EMAP domain
VKTVDTAKDARVLMLEDALSRLNHIVTQRTLKLHISYNELAKILSSIESVFYEVKYSYVESTALADMDATKKLLDAIMKFRAVYEQAIKSTGFIPENVKDRLVHSEVRYALRIIDGFANRLNTFDEDPGHAIDILAVEITQINHIEGSKNLTECRCTDGTRIWTIVTNIQGISVGAKLSCAVLPPVEMMGIVSEAMFLGNERLADSIQLGRLSSQSSEALNQARAQVMGLIKRLK